MKDHKEESAIHKAWVALKGDVGNTHRYDGRIDLYLYFHNEYGYVCYHSLTFKNTTMICSVKEFTDYCEKMAAEERRIDIIGQNGNDGLHYDNTAHQAEALAANDKPVFTQKIADEKELKERFDLITPYNRCIGQIAAYLKVTTSGVDVPGNNPKLCATAEDIINGIENIANYDSHQDIEWMPKRDSECLFSYGGSDWRNCKYIGKSTVGSKSYAVLFVHKKGNYENFKFCSDLKFKPIDTRTDREKAIDEMFEDAKVQGSKGAFERLYDAGYRKC